MIETLFALKALASLKAFIIAVLIGLGFGIALERAGFGSSRKLSGIFYFKDMTVLKVMFTGLLTAMLGLNYLIALGIVKIGSVYLLSTIYQAQIVGGLIFGIGFVIGGWCPGTAAVGIASGKIDAAIFLIGAIIGSVFFNEMFPIVKGLYNGGHSGVLMIYDSLGISKQLFAFIFTFIAVFCFWGAELVEKKVTKESKYLNSSFLKIFSIVLLLMAAGLFVIPSLSIQAPHKKSQQLLQDIENGAEHISPVTLASTLLEKQSQLLVVDVRSASQYAKFHIRGAINIPLSQLIAKLKPYKNKKQIVLYSNGMIHPAQARDTLWRLGYRNVFILTDGLRGFIERCLKPVSLRSQPLSAKETTKINAWRKYFYGP